MRKLSLHVFSALACLCCASAVQAENALPELELLSEAQLQQRLTQAPPDERGAIHIFIGRVSMDRDPNFARQQLRSADALISQDNLIERSYLSSTWCWLDMLYGDLAKARARCDKGTELALASSDPWAIVKAYRSAGMLNYQMGDLFTAEQLAQEALEYAQVLGGVEMIALQFNALGLITRAQGRHRQALEYFSSGLALVSLETYEEIYRVLSFNVGIAYADLGQHEIAQDFYREPLAWAVETQRYTKELTALVYLAISHNALGQAQQTIDTLGQALLRPELRENHGYLAFAYSVLGEAYLEQQNFEQALIEFERGMDIIASDPNTFEQRRVKIGYSRALFETGAVDEARVNLSATIEQLRNENARTELLNALELMGRIEESEGNYQSSLAAIKESSQLSFDFRKQAFEHQLATIRGKLELDEKNQELAKSRQETIVRNGIILLSFAFAFIAYLGFSRRHERQRAESEAEHAEELEVVVLERTRELELKVEQTNLAESARLALERQLAEAEKLRVLGQLTGGVAHDFNNLLTVVIGAAELLKESLPDEKNHDELLQHIISAATSGSDITQALMSYARKQPLQLETVVLNDALRERVPLVSRTLGGMVNVVLDIDSAPPVEVVLDKSQLVSALLNLALNARDAQNSQGDVLIRLDIREGRWAVISVVDSGCGMTEEQIQRAVEPFYTTKDEAHGNGLGLSMVYGFSKQLGGDLEIDSVLAEGTTVRLVLPLAHLANSRVYEVDFSRGKS